MNSQLYEAIKEGLVIEFYYGGGKRLVEPFCYGIDNAGTVVLRGYQIGGYSKSSPSEGWRLFKERDISNLIVTDQRFTNLRPGYNPNDPAIISIFCRVS